ncbi:MAG: hypothetical protein IPO53_11865 [Chitinophagaceae bacterium]|nr:hypothetical protein [Chitinophagaceae bacterium]
MVNLSHIFLFVSIVLTACNSGAKKKNITGTDTTSQVSIIKPEPPIPEILPDDGQVGVRKRAVFIFKNRGFELFSGGGGNGRQYASVVNMYSRLRIPGIKIYNLIIPNGFEFEVTEKYKKLITPAKEAIRSVFAAEDPEIIKVNPIDEIRKHRTEYIYFNTDHHWTSLGAYYAYRSFCNAAGLTPVSLDTIPSKVKPGFLGLFHRLTRSVVLKNNPDSVRYYLFPDSINFYIGSSNSIKYWAKSKMYADSRYYSGDFIAMLKAEGINELLFLNNIFAAHTPFHISNIKGLMNPGSPKAKP